MKIKRPENLVSLFSCMREESDWQKFIDVKLLTLGKMQRSLENTKVYITWKDMIFNKRVLVSFCVNTYTYFALNGKGSSSKTYQGGVGS